MKTRVYRLELTGMVFGRLTVVGQAQEKGTRGEVNWHCQCSCGNRIVARAANLRRGSTQSCGCFHREQVSTHGMTGLPTFKSWESMKQRCTNPNSPDYSNYGGRGISVCERWRNSFDAFLSDMGDRPKGKTLSRIDNDGNYEPSNCTWATVLEQQRNTRVTRKALWDGRLCTIYELAEISGIAPKIIGDRLYAGWSVEKTMTTPSRKRLIKQGD